MPGSNYKVEITADTGKFSRGMKSAKTSLDGLGSSVFSVKNAVVGLAGVGGIGLLVKSTADANRETLSYARALNVSVRELGAWQFAAQSAGLQGDKVADIFKDVSEKIGDAFRNGGGEAKEVLESLNLDLAEMVNLSPDKQLLKIAGALGEVGSQSEKVQIMEALASDAALLLPLLESDAAALRELRQEAIENNAALSDVDSAKIEMANRALDRMGGVVKGVSNTIVVALVPYLEVTAKWLLEVTKKAGGVGEVTQSSMSVAANSIGYVITAVEYLQIGWEVSKLAVLAFAESALISLNAIVNPIRQINELLGNDQVESLEFLTHLQGAFAKSSIESQAKVLELVSTVGQTAENVAGALQEVKQAADEVANIQVNAAVVSDVDASQDGLNAVEIAQAIEDEKTAIFVSGLAARLDAERVAAEEIMSINDNLAAQFSVGMGNAVADVIVDQKNLGEVLKGVLKSVVKQIIGSYVALAIKRAFFSTQATAASILEAKALGLSWATPAALASVATLGGAAAVGSTALSLSVAQANGLAIAGAREFGGPVDGGKSYLVGERGPEIFTAPLAGNIIPNDKIGGGNSISFSPVIYANDSQSFNGQIDNSFTHLWNRFMEKMNEEGVNFS